MVIDADTHISPQPEGGLSIHAEELIRRMDKAGVDKALTWVHPPYIKTRLNEYVQYVYESTKKFPDRLYGLGWVDPHLGIESAIELTKKCMHEYGFYGIKLNGSQNGYYIDDQELTYPLIEIVAECRGIVAFHSANDDPTHVHPYLVERIAKDFPDTKILLIHMGGESYGKDLSRAAIEAAEHCKNITLVGSEVVKPSLIKALKVLGSNRVAYGSDTPFAHMGAEVAAYKVILEDIGFSKTEKDQVMGKNIAKLIGVI